MAVSANDEGRLDKELRGPSGPGFFDHDRRASLHADACRHGRRGHQDRDQRGRDDADPAAAAQRCSTAFGQLNVGKKSLVLDLKSPEGVEAVRRLVATADILVENFRPGVMRRLRLDYDAPARSQSKTDLLLDLRLRPDRAVGRTAGLRAGHPCGLRLRHGASRLPARPQPAGLLRHLPCRRAHRHLRVRRHRVGAAISATAAGRASTSTSRCWNRC